MKKLTSLLLALTIIISCFCTTIFAETDATSEITREANSELVVWEEDGLQIIFLGVSETPSLSRDILVRTFKFDFLARAQYSSGSMVDVATFSVTQQSGYDGYRWERRHTGQHSYNVITGPFRLIFWECTYSTPTYWQSAFEYEWRGGINTGKAIPFNLNTSNGIISLG